MIAMNKLDFIWSMNEGVSQKEFDEWVTKIDTQKNTSIISNSEIESVDKRSSIKEALNFQIVILKHGSGVNHWHVALFQKMKLGNSTMNYAYYLIHMSKLKYISNLTYEVKSNKIIIMGINPWIKSKVELLSIDIGHHFV
jgi:hypothetical protein